MSSPMQSIFFNLRTGYLYKLCKLETNLDTRKEQYAVEMAEMIRVGDARPLRMPTHFLKDKYELLAEDETKNLWQFLADNKNQRNLPIKYKQGVFDYGHESEAWRPNPTSISDDLMSEFESLVQEKQTLPSLKIGTLINPTEQDSFDRIVATSGVISSIKQGLAKIKYQDFLSNNWNMKSLNTNQGRSIMNFYGPPGTGKTLSAKAVAFNLKQKLLHVDYAQVESKWVGETGKNIQKVFEAAREHNAVILFDEADSLVSKRSKDTGNNANYVNENRNIFMQEMDKFSGVVILTTNLFENYDEALLRRISQHIGFELPSIADKEKLYRQHIPREVNLSSDVDFSFLARISENFSGGDIKVATEEAMVQACIEAAEMGKLEEACLKSNHLEFEIDKIKKAKQAHGGMTRKPMGIGVAS